MLPLKSNSRLNSKENFVFEFQPVMMPGDVPHNLNVEEKRPRNQIPGGDRGGMGGGNRGGRGGYRPNYDRADR